MSAALWFCGFLFSLPIVQPYELARLAAVIFVTAALGGSLVPQLAGPGLALPRSPLPLFMLLFWGLGVLSVIWSPALNVSFMALCLFSLLPMSFFAFLVTGDEKTFRRLFAAVGVVSGALALWVFVQFFFLPEMLVQDGVRRPFADSNAYAAFLSLSFFPALGIMVSGTRRLETNAAMALCALCLGAMVVLGSRSAIAGLLAGLTLFFLLAMPLSKTNILRMTAVLAAAVSVFLSLVFVTPSSVSRINPASHLIARDASLPESYQTRQDLWRSTLAMIHDRPFSGTGIGTYFLYYPEYRQISETKSAGLMAHSDPLQFAAEMGLVAPALFYLALAAAVLRMAAALRMSPAADPRRVIAGALFCGAGAVVLHAHVSFNFYVAPVLMLTGFVLAWWMLLTGDILPKDKAVPFRLPRAAAWGSVVVPLALFLFAAQGFFMATHHLNRAKNALANGNMDAFASAVNAAGRAGFGRDAQAYVMAATIPLGILGKADGRAEREKLRMQVLALLDKAEEHNPRSVMQLYYRATLALDLGRPEDAEKHLRRALTLEPQHLPSRLMLADIYERQGQKDKMFETLKAGLPWFYTRHDPRPYYERIKNAAHAVGDRKTEDQVNRMAAKAAMFWQIRDASPSGQGDILPASP